MVRNFRGYSRPVLGKLARLGHLSRFEGGHVEGMLHDLLVSVLQSHELLPKNLCVLVPATSALLETRIGGQIRCASTRFGIASVISWHKG